MTELANTGLQPSASLAAARGKFEVTLALAVAEAQSR
jgi:hypothetical protein